MVKKLISSKEVWRMTCTDSEETKEHLLECAKKIIIEEVKKVFDFEKNMHYNSGDINDDDYEKYYYINIVSDTFSNIYDYQIFPHKKFDDWLAQSGWKLKRKDLTCFWLCSLKWNDEE